jgi:signal-transduction protein with cAMP-binding, CBS, and nucleotidyltransferase domain
MVAVGFTLEVRDVMTYPAITKDEEASVAQLARGMKLSGIGSVIITKEDKAVGIVTDRDIVIKVIMKNREPDKVKAKEIMSSPLVTIESDVSLKDACKSLIEKGIRRLPVIEGGALMGIISLRNIVTREPLHVKTYPF